MSVHAGLIQYEGWGQRVSYVVQVVKPFEIKAVIYDLQFLQIILFIYCAHWCQTVFPVHICSACLSAL